MNRSLTTGLMPDEEEGKKDCEEVQESQDCEIISVCCLNNFFETIIRLLRMYRLMKDSSICSLEFSPY
jgi:hypothetical protein